MNQNQNIKKIVLAQKLKKRKEKKSLFKNTFAPCV